MSKEAAAIEEWWSSPRWKGIVRPYVAQEVVSLRGSLEASYQSDQMAKKLFATLTECAATGGHSRTYGALDTVQATTMAPKLTSIYVSGWQSSSTASSSNEPGPDFADYPSLSGVFQSQNFPESMHATRHADIAQSTLKPRDD